MATTSVSFGPWEMDNATIPERLNDFCRATSGPPPSENNATKFAWVNDSVYHYVEGEIRRGRRMLRDSENTAETNAEIAALKFEG